MSTSTLTTSMGDYTLSVEDWNVFVDYFISDRLIVWSLFLV